MRASMMQDAPNKALLQRLIHTQWQESRYAESILLNRFDMTVCGYSVTVRYSIQPDARFRHWVWEVRNRNTVLASGNAHHLGCAKHEAIECATRLACGDEAQPRTATG
jgi:hypothetical protein